MCDLSYHFAPVCAVDIESVRREVSILFEKKGKFTFVGHSCHS